MKDRILLFFEALQLKHVGLSFLLSSVFLWRCRCLSIHGLLQNTVYIKIPQKPLNYDLPIVRRLLKCFEKWKNCDVTEKKTMGVNIIDWARKKFKKPRSIDCRFMM